MNLKRAIEKIEEAGGLLVFPLDNRAEPQSLWAKLYPKSEMRWEWDEAGDDRVVKLWHLRTELSVCKEVVYTKWYKGRATFFSRTVFQALLAELAFPRKSIRVLSQTAQTILRVLEEDSPLSTKELKKQTGLKGKDHESEYTKALKSLFERGLIVGFGEVDDGAFPSLAIGATLLLFDELWEEAKTLSRAQVEKHLNQLFLAQPLFKKEF
ncbi:MAG: hypothetical protein ACKN9V_00200 [Pseudomonadota bacterium]